MNTRLRALLLPALLLAPIFAQEEEGFAMGPAPEIKKLESLIGNWTGSGSMTEPTGAETAWKAQGSYRWCLNNHFVREDFRIEFDGNPEPMVFRAFIGWDRENSRYVNAVANNIGQAKLHEVTFLPDGTLLQMVIQHQGGMSYVERSQTKVDGDAMTMTIDMLMPQGASMQMVEGKFTKTDKSFDGDFDAKPFMGAQPNDQMKMLVPGAGIYSLKGEMVMVPGQPALGITGTDRFEMVWGGSVMMGRTEGMAEGAPEKYESHAFWGWDEKRNCMTAVFADNMGQIGEMTVHWVDGKFVSISAGLQMGMPTTQRFVLELDDKGAFKSGVGHTAMGAMPPFESFRATYKKKQIAGLR